MAKQQKKNKIGSLPTEQTATAFSWHLDNAWITGFSGVLATIVCAVVFQVSKVLTDGIILFGDPITNNQQDSILVALGLICLTMAIVQLARQFRNANKPFILVDPSITAGHHFNFLLKCVGIFLIGYFLLWLIQHFYQTGSEFGFTNKGRFYQPFFRILDLFSSLYLWLGLPYILVTRAYQYDPLGDRHDHQFIVSQVGILVASYIPGFRHLRPTFGNDEKTAWLNLIVKMFFVPFSTVFFVEQFPYLVNNIGYLLDGLPNSLGAPAFDLGKLNSDIANITTNLFFTIHLAIAWSAYTLTSRWLGNTNRSLAPKLRNWMICLMCFPPFFGLLTSQFISIPVDDYMSKPADILMRSSQQWVVSLMIIVMTICYFIYTAASAYLGLNYSNLSHRGLVRTGPYSVVRHPAYAAKIIALATALIPLAIYHCSEGEFKIAGTVIAGLIIATSILYLRAITEEQHLLQDDQYLTYCKQVRFRFIPGVV